MVQLGFQDTDWVGGNDKKVYNAILFQDRDSCKCIINNSTIYQTIKFFSQANSNDQIDSTKLM